MSRATASLPRTIGAHAALLALHGDRALSGRRHHRQLVQVARRDLPHAAFAADIGDLRPDRLHDGAETGRFPPLFPEQPDRHGRIAVLRALVRRDGRLRFVGIPLPRQHHDGPLSGARHHDPDPARHRRHPAADGGKRAGEHADRAHPRLHRARPAARRLHPLRIHEAGVGRSEERRPHRRSLASIASSSASCCRWSGPRWRRSRSSP